MEDVPFDSLRGHVPSRQPQGSSPVPASRVITVWLFPSAARPAEPSEIMARRITVKRAPPPAGEVAEMVPPWATTIRRAMASPNPVPPSRDAAYAEGA